MMNSKKLIRKISIGAALSLVACAAVGTLSSIKVSASPGLLGRLARGFSVSAHKTGVKLSNPLKGTSVTLRNVTFSSSSGPKNPYGNVDPGTVGRAFAKWVAGGNKTTSILKPEGAQGNTKGFGHGQVTFNVTAGERTFNDGSVPRNLSPEKFIFSKLD